MSRSPATAAESGTDPALDPQRTARFLRRMHMDSLRPEENHISDKDEVVLVTLGDEPPETVTVRWRVTAQDINDVFRQAPSRSKFGQSHRRLSNRSGRILHGRQGPEAAE